MPQPSSTNHFGKVFIWIAWLLALAMLTFVFNDVLEEQINPNQQPQSLYNSDGLGEVVLKQNRQGHYVTTGTINGVVVTFLLDTGATQVSIPAHIAKKIALPTYGSYFVQTANGRTKVYQTKIDELSIGRIFLYNIEANINPSMQSDEILLGMSALKKLDFQQTGKQLILREKHAL
jgi:aspartyl protease family protein